jgi:hypothetical protein
MAYHLTIVVYRDPTYNAFPSGWLFNQRQTESCHSVS